MIFAFVEMYDIMKLKNKLINGRNDTMPKINKNKPIKIISEEVSSGNWIFENGKWKCTKKTDIDKFIYQESYIKEPKEILNYVIEDMLDIMGNADVDDNMINTVTKWRYVLMQIESKL